MSRKYRIEIGVTLAIIIAWGAIYVASTHQTDSCRGVCSIMGSDQ